MAGRDPYYGAPRGAPRGGRGGRGGAAPSRGGYDAHGAASASGYGRGAPAAPPGYGAAAAPAAYPDRGYDAYAAAEYTGYGAGYAAAEMARAAAYSGGYPGASAFPPGYGQPPAMSTSPLDDEIQMVIGEIHGEINAFESAGEWSEQFKNARRLLTTEADKLENSIDPEWLEVDIEKPIKVSKKVLIPNYRHPKFNFVGKVLGPKGATLQALARAHKCHIFVLGRGSTKDQRKEHELLMSGDPQFAHYGGPLHVKVETIAPAHIAYQRVAGVLEELSRILQPIREDTTPAHLKEHVSGSSKDGENGSGDNTADDSKPDSAMGSSSSTGGGPMRGGYRGRGRGRPGPY